MSVRIGSPPDLFFLEANARRLPADRELPKAAGKALGPHRHGSGGTHTKNNRQALLPRIAEQTAKGRTNERERQKNTNFGAVGKMEIPVRAVGRISARKA